MIGTTLNHYRITGQLGKGGMGEVYLAEDMPRLSFDGKWLAYNSNETGTWQVYAVSFPDGPEPELVP